MAGALNIKARDFLGFKNAREVPWQQLRYEHVEAIRTKLGERYKPATANRYLSALKGSLAPGRVPGGKSSSACGTFAPSLDPRCPRDALSARVSSRRRWTAACTVSQEKPLSGAVNFSLCLSACNHAEANLIGFHEVAFGNANKLELFPCRVGF